MANIDFEHKLFNFQLTPSANCSYLANRTSCHLYLHQPAASQSIAGDLLAGDLLAGDLLAGGFRRHRDIYYRPVCRDCRACLSVRIPTAKFDFTRRSVKRSLRRNRDLTFELSPAVADEALYNLFCRYMEMRHVGSEVLSYEEFVLLLEIGSDASCLYKAYDGSGDLLAVIFVDRHGGSYSAVHSFYGGLAKRGLGTWLIYRLLEEVMGLGVDYIYLGYWVDGCRAMEYKSRFRPLEVYHEGAWFFS